MTAAYRLKGIGWFLLVAAMALGFYLVSLRVAAERNRLDAVNTRIAAAERDIRALETEFDTRANLAQLEKWNGDALALASPTAEQFVGDEAQLARLDPNAPVGATVRTTALVVPSLPEALPAPVVAPGAPVSQPVPVPVPAAAAVAVAGPLPGVTRVAAVQVVAPTGRTAPALARLADAARGAVAVAKVRPQAVAMLDRKLLSDTTFGDIMAGARAELRKR